MLPTCSRSHQVMLVKAQDQFVMATVHGSYQSLSDDVILPQMIRTSVIIFVLAGLFSLWKHHIEATHDGIIIEAVHDVHKDWRQPKLISYLHISPLTVPEVGGIFDPDDR
jgi:hypothetical protein